MNSAYICRKHSRYFHIRQRYLTTYMVLFKIIVCDPIAITSLKLDTTSIAVATAIIFSRLAKNYKCKRSCENDENRLIKKGYIGARTWPITGFGSPPWNWRNQFCVIISKKTRPCVEVKFGRPSQTWKGYFCDLKSIFSVILLPVRHNLVQNNFFYFLKKYYIDGEKFWQAETYTGYPFPVFFSEF